MSIRLSVFYFSAKSIIGLAQSKTITNANVYQEPPELLNLLTNVHDVGDFILRILGHSKQGIPDPKEISEQSMLDLAGVKSLRAFNKIWKKSVYVVNENNTYKIYPTKHEGSGALFLTEKIIELESPDPKLLGEKLLEAYELSL